MNRRNLLGGAAAVALTAFGPAAAATGRKKNFIVIYCDDMGYGDIGPDGNTVIPTPNLDRMAREGTVLANYYAPANLCTPSRAGLLTGRYPIRAGQALMLGPASTTGLPLTNPTIPKTLKAAGYVSAMVGKWHLGSKAPFWPPTQYGYDYFYGIPYSHDMWPLSIFEARAGRDKVEQITPDLKSMQDQFYRHAEKFIEDNAARAFFVNMSFSAPHLPSWVPDEFVGKSQVGDYGDTIVQLDSFVGRLMNKLEELKIADNTLIIFTSDNGPWYWGSNGPFRARKSQPGYDGGYRVPFIAWLPGVVRAGQRASGLASGMDIFPTICHLAGVPVPADIVIDGIDMTPMLTQGAPSERKELFLFMDEDLVGLRAGRWKFLINKTYSAHTPSPDRYGYGELYDLETDISEDYNVASKYPDIAARLRTRLLDAKKIFDPMRTRPEVHEAPIHFLGDTRPIWNDR
jgi:arylsulfatase A-like enzyme